MKSLRQAIVTLLLADSSLSAATHYVSWESTTPTPPYNNWGTLVATNILGQADVTTCADTNVTGPFFYRVGVKCP